MLNWMQNKKVIVYFQSLKTRFLKKGKNPYELLRQMMQEYFMDFR